MKTRLIFDSCTNSWSGPEKVRKDNSFHYKKSLGEHIIEAFTKHSDRIAQISDNNGVTLTYAQLLKQSICVAQNLQKIGCTNDDIVVIMMKNGHMADPIIFGCILAGVPINSWHLTVDLEDMKSLLKIVQPKVIISDEEYAEMIREAMIATDQNSIFFDSAPKIETLFKETGESFKPPPNSEKCGFYVLSSGTTGLYKISTFKESFWIDLCLSSDLDPNTIAFSFVNSSWMGVVLRLITGACQGITRILTTEPFSPELMIDIIEKYKVNRILTNPLFLKSMTLSERFKEANFSDLNLIVSSGSILPSAVKAEYINHHPHVDIFNSYGMTELGGRVITYKNINLENNVLGPLDAGVSARIVDGDNNQLGPNETGTIRIKLDEFGLKEYYKNEEDSIKLFDESGFMITGDVGYFDDRGFLTVTGRDKDLIRNTKGEIHPLIMEQLISKHKDVEEVVIVGVVDECLDNIPAAAVVKREGSSITEKDILEFVEGFDCSVNLHGGVYFLNELPKTSTEKIIRFRVREMLNKLYHVKHGINE